MGDKHRAVEKVNKNPNPAPTRVFKTGPNVAPNPQKESSRHSLLFEQKMRHSEREHLLDAPRVWVNRKDSAGCTRCHVL